MGIFNLPNLPFPALLSQLLLGLVNGSFYAILSLGLAVIFGLLNVINFAHGALFMMGAVLTWMGLNYFNISYWAMLVLAPARRTQCRRAAVALAGRQPSRQNQKERAGWRRPSWLWP